MPSTENETETELILEVKSGKNFTSCRYPREILAREALYSRQFLKKFLPIARNIQRSDRHLHKVLLSRVPSSRLRCDTAHYDKHLRS